MAVSVGSRTTSFAPSVSSEYGSYYEPSLAFSQSTLNGRSSAKTGDPEALVQVTVLEEDDEGALHVPTTNEGALACPFGFLNCTLRFDSVQVWDTHCKSHYMGRLPKVVYCPFRCNWTHKSESPSEAWDIRFDHIISKHRGDVEVDADRRPAVPLYKHFFNRRIITDDQYKQIMATGRIAGSQAESPAFLKSAGRLRDDRQSRKRH